MNLLGHRILVVGTILFLMSVAAACGGGENEDSPPPETPASVAPATAPSPAVAQLKLYVSSPLSTPLATGVSARLQSALAASGYTLVDTESTPHDLTARLAVTATQERSFFSMTVNGRPQVKLRVHASMTVSAAGSVLDQVSTDFESSNNEVSDQNVAPLVSRLNGSSRLARYATDQAKLREAADRAQQAAADQQKRDAEDREHAAKEQWDAVVGDCRAPVNAHSCDSLLAWYQSTGPRRQPGSTDTYLPPPDPKRDEAKKILDAAAPAIRDFADADAWSQVDVGRCTNAATSDDCSSISAYLSRFPNGQHATDAQAAFNRGEAKLAAEERLAQQRAASQQRAAAAAQSVLSCKSDCAQNKCVAYTTDDKKQQCIASCQAGCK
jgi:hypothetical protein